ncbi:MAG: pyridoxamine 5'-phosphate oxidase family protein [Gemmatimonadetes bacterium]|nr:pyridoxamine 5'-phosphate oxidase family protein [Gemmatimonadota bacterium]
MTRRRHPWSRREGVNMKDAADSESLAFQALRRSLFGPRTASCTRTCMSQSGKPIIGVLEADEARALLARNRVGRIAYALGDLVEIEPIHYIQEASWIFACTSPGARLLTLPSGSWCAFETDEVRGMCDWQSVVVKGPFTQESSAAGWDLDRAVAALRRLLPTALTVYDPTPKRDVVFAIHISEISGRYCVSNGSFEGEPVAAQSVR